MAKASTHFWSDHQSSPKRQYRWIMNIGGIPQWIVKKVNKPAFSISEGVHKYLNHTFYYPGRVEYEKTTITLVDPIAPDASAIMMEILTNSGYRIPDNQDDTITISKKKAVEALGNVVISQLGAEGDIADQFTFINPWMSSVKFGDLDYEGDNLIDLTLELRYDFVQMTKVGSKGFAKYAGNGKKAGVTTAGGGKGAAGGKPIDI